jgi:hypothetical protein
LSRESLLKRRSSRKQDYSDTDDTVITELSTIKSSEVSLYIKVKILIKKKLLLIIKKEVFRQPSNSTTIKTIQERNIRPNEILKSSRSKNMYLYHFK